MSIATEWRHGGGTVGTSSKQLSTDETPAYEGILISADADNAGIIYFGANEGVTADRSATGGIELRAGSTRGIPINAASKIWIIASEPGQGYSFGAF